MKVLLKSGIVLDGTSEEVLVYLSSKTPDEIAASYRSGESWTPEEKTLLLKLRTEKVPMPEIAKRMGRSEIALSTFFHRSSLYKKLPPRIHYRSFKRKKATKRRPRANSFWSKDEKTAAVGMCRQGLDCKKIARTVGRTPKAVECYLYKQLPEFPDLVIVTGRKRKRA
jgi:transposase-like protein